MRRNRAGLGSTHLSAWLIGAVMVAVPLAAGPALAAPTSTRTVIEVFPGSHAIGNAIAGANAGDTLNIHTGTYPESFSITKDDLLLVAAGDGPVTVDGQCGSTWTINISGDGIGLRQLTVIGGRFGEVTFSGAASGSAQSIVATDTCAAAEYGINVFLSGSIAIGNTVTSGFGDAGIYIGAITSTPLGPMVVQGNDSFDNERGIIVEDSAGGVIRVTRNRFHDNVTTGIWVHNSDRVFIRGNVVTDNGDIGIDVDPTSDRNQILRNRASGHTFDLANEGGTANCFRDNEYTTSMGDIAC